MSFSFHKLFTCIKNYFKTGFIYETGKPIVMNRNKDNSRVIRHHEENMISQATAKAKAPASKASQSASKASNSSEESAIAYQYADEQKIKDRELAEEAKELSNCLMNPQLSQNWLVITNLIEERNSFVDSTNRDYRGAGYLESYPAWREIGDSIEKLRELLKEDQTIANQRTHNRSYDTQGLRDDDRKCRELILDRSMLISESLNQFVPSLEAEAQNNSKSVYIDLVELQHLNNELDSQYQMAETRHSQITGITKGKKSVAEVAQ